MINFEWEKPILEVKLVDGSLENVIKTVHWRYKGTKNDINKDVYGAVTLPNPNEQDFIVFEEMTNEQIFEWLESILNIEELKSNITLQIDKEENPEVLIKTIE